MGNCGADAEQAMSPWGRGLRREDLCVWRVSEVAKKSLPLSYDGSQFLNSVECYDPATDEWKPVTPMNIKRSRVSLVANVNCLYAIAG